MATPLSFLSMSTTTSDSDQPTKTHVDPNSTPKPIQPHQLAGGDRGGGGRKSRNHHQQQTRPKKLPQRGMGVAQLERLRIQERLKNFTNPSNPHILNLHPSSSSSAPPLLPDPINIPSPLHHGFPFINGGAGLICCWRGDEGMKMTGPNKKMEENGGLGGCCCPVGFNNGVFGSGQGTVKNQSMVNAVGAVFETSKELSSMPTVPKTMMMPHYCYYYEPTDPTCCDLCAKKSRFHGQENMGYNGRRSSDKDSEISPVINGSDHLGLNPGGRHNISFNGHIDGFGARAARSALFANHNHHHNEDVQVVAVHHGKGNPSVGGNGGGYFIEYEFFPGKNGGILGASSKELKLAGVAEPSSVAVGGGRGEEASSVRATSSDYSGYGASINASNSIDLSLKLSY